MPTDHHHVRRLSVDVSVPDLDQAVALRSRLEDLAKVLFPQVLERVLDAAVPANGQVRLTRLDLDLGTIGAARLETDALAAFETALARALSETLDRLSGAPAMDRPAGDRLLTPEQAQIELAEHYLSSGTFPYWASTDAPAPGRLLATLAAVQPEALADLLRRHGRNPVVPERLVLQLGEKGLRRLLAALVPADAAVILAYLDDLSLLHRTEPLLPRPAPAVDRLFWLVTIEYLVREAGSQFNRRSFLRDVLLGVADRERVSYGALLDLLRRGVERIGRQRPLGSSLPAVLRELLETEDPPAAPPPSGKDSPGTAVEHRPDTNVPDDDEALLTLLRRNLRNRPALAALVERLSPLRFARLVERLEPAHAALILAFLADLAHLHREDALLLLSAEGFDRLTRLLVLIHLLRDPGSQFNRRSWLRFLLEGLAEREGIAYERMLDLLVRSLARTAGRRPPASSLPALVTELAAEQEPETPPAEPDVPALQALDPGGIAATIRKAASGPPADLARLVAALDNHQRAAVLDHLHPTSAPQLREAMEWLLRRHRSRPLMALDDGAFLRLLWTAVLRRAALPPHPAYSLLDAVVTDLAAFAGAEPAGFRAAMTGGEPAGNALPALLAQRVEASPTTLTGNATETGQPPLLARANRFLRQGTPPADGDALVLLLDSDPAGLLTLLRQLAADAALWPEQLDRLLGRLLPEEIAALPGLEHGGEAARWVRALTNGRGNGTGTEGGDGDRQTAWARILTALLRREAPGIAEAPPPAGKPLDRLALLRHWLDHGRPPWWAEDGDATARRVAALPDMPLIDLLGLFQCQDIAQSVNRLHRAVEALGRDAAAVLLRRLAPSAFAPGLRDPDTPGRSRSPAEERKRRHQQVASVAALLSGRATPPDEAPSATESTEAGPPPPATAAEQTAGPGRIDRQALLDWLSGGGSDDPPWGDALVRGLADLLDGPDPAVDELLTAALRTEAARSRWLARLPDEILGRLLHRIEPALADVLLDLVALLGAAWRQTVAPERRSGDPRKPWAVFLGCLAMAPPGHRSARTMAAAMLHSLAGNDPAQEKPLLARARFLAGEAGHAGLIAVLHPPPVRPPPPPPATPPKRKPWRFPRGGNGAAMPGEPLYVDNAGLALLNPFLPHFFDRLGVLSPSDTGAPRIGDPEAAAKAVHLLQYLVDGMLEDGCCNRPEPALVLNKLLCGLDPAVPVEPVFRPAAEDLALCDQLLTAAIATWTIISNTSLAGLRETFLMREGRLERGERRWTLTVQRKTVDVLVDRVPWSFSTIYHRWMDDPLHVTW